jgi:Arc/MetJ-type ribon-helix-helix transcriptional regulator
MPDIHKVSVALTGDQLAALTAAVESGEYATTSEIIREAIRLAIQARASARRYQAPPEIVG